MEIIQPYRVFNAFNPAILTVTNPTDPTRIARVRLDFVINGGLPDVYSTTVYRESFNDRVVVDLAKFVKGLLDNKIADINARVFTDSTFAKQVNISVIDVDNNALAWQACVLRAVVQFGQSQDVANLQGKFLTHRTVVNKYEGYPLDLAALAFNTGKNADYMLLGVNDEELWELEFIPHVFIRVNDGDTSVNMSNMSGYTELANTNLEFIYDTDNNVIVVYNPEDGYLMQRIAVNNVCTPKNPFYVRWANDLGGFDYQMFTTRQTLTTSAENETSYLQYYEDSALTTRAKITTGLEVSESVTFGVSNLTNKEYSIVKDLLVSPQIEYYDTTLSKWLALYRDDSVEISQDNFNERHTFETTLYKNPRILQF